MMEVAVEIPQPPAWDHFKEEVEVMETEGGGTAVAAAAAAAGELLTREINKRLLVHAHENGNGHGHVHANGGGAEELKAAPEVEQKEEEKTPEEPTVAQEEQQRHKSIFFDPAKGLWKCRHCDWTYRLSSPCGNGTVDHQGYRHRIERNIESLVEKKGSFYGSPNKVPDIINEVSARYLVSGTMQSGAKKEDADETLSTKDKHLEAHENGNVQSINHGPSNGKLENGSHSNGSHQVPDGAEPKTEYLFEINKTEIYPAEVDKDKQVTEAQPKVEEYDLEKILDQQETHDLFCPNCKSCITRRVILKKRKRTVRPATPDGPSKRPYTEEVLVPLPSATLPASDEQDSPDVFRCLSCFSFFIPAGCSFNIFRIFGRRDVLPPPASEDTPPWSENCTSWILSCFQPGDSPNQPAPAADTVPLLSGTQSSDNTTTATESSSSYVHYSHGTVVKPKPSTIESSLGNQAAEDPVTLPLQSETQNSSDTTTTTESSTYVHHSHGAVVKPEHSEHQTTKTTTTRTTKATATSSSTTTSKAANTSSRTQSATGIFHTDTLEVITGEMPPPKPAGGAIMDGNHHLLGHEDVHKTATTTFENGFTTHSVHTSGVKVDGPNVTNIARGDITTTPIPQATGPHHVAVSVPEEVNQVAPRPQQRDDWDILKAVVYGGLVESVTSLSVVSAAASSGAKTLDIFILGMANLIGGLPVIFHNIADLRDIQDVSDDNERVGHYWLQLGRRSKARLHMVLALLSYMVFGLLPPVLYGLSFRESNDRENKMMAVAGASMACIALLALGKAHVQTAPRAYFKTLMYYLTIAVSSSGLSYVTGVLITRLLEHFGVIEQGGSAAPAPPGLWFPHSEGAQTSAWASF
ncbi:membrane protein of ER body-like protein isoform X2 [Triticum dicoccoides]|uniref:membrane protein of ER body-like protein isoform X2 n=1 Tax=Triticum dicoccoides TaxID=85692 RepID=UPI00188E2B7D|nr:membrane protein of ER body-like protein isoform X2 [Triticum dicoccoides]